MKTAFEEMPDLERYHYIELAEFPRLDAFKDTDSDEIIVVSAEPSVDYTDADTEVDYVTVLNVRDDAFDAYSTSEDATFGSLRDALSFADRILHP